MSHELSEPRDCRPKLPNSFGIWLAVLLREASQISQPSNNPEQKSSRLCKLPQAVDMVLYIYIDISVFLLSIFTFVMGAILIQVSIWYPYLLLLGFIIIKMRLYLQLMYRLLCILQFMVRRARRHSQQNTTFYSNIVTFACYMYCLHLHCSFSLRYLVWILCVMY